MCHQDVLLPHWYIAHYFSKRLGVDGIVLERERSVNVFPTGSARLLVKGWHASTHTCQVEVIVELDNSHVNVLRSSFTVQMRHF